MLVDTHCHIHESEFYDRDEREAVYGRAVNEDVRMICVGTSEAASREAVQFVSTHPHTWAVIGVHPHDATAGYNEIETILKEKHQKVVGIGEIGLDYYYMNSPRQAQIAALEQQLQWAADYHLPVSFHVRDGKEPSVWDDFWPIFANFPGIQGVLHSFTDSTETMEKGLSEGLYIGVNGISTFARDKQAMWDTIPLEKMVLETDAPFLTPTPHRGKVNEPAYVKLVAAYHADRRAMPLEALARATTNNATQLFSM